MRWTSDQQASKALRDHFGDPPPSGQGLEIWASEIAEYVLSNLEPIPELGHRYILDDGAGAGSHIGYYVAEVPDSRVDVWIFQIFDTDGDHVYEEHSRETIVDDYALWRVDQEAQAAEAVEGTSKIPAVTATDAEVRT